MKLRTHLFLGIGGIFAFAFVLSLVFETRATDKNLQKAQEHLRTQISTIREEGRRHIEEYLHVFLIEKQSLIDALLLRMNNSPKLSSEVFLEKDPLSTLANSSQLFKDNSWLDFIQITKDNKLISLLIPLDKPMGIGYEVFVREGVSWVVLEGNPSPFIGISISASSQEKATVEQLLNKEEGMLVLFDPHKLMEWENISFSSVFANSLQAGVQYLKETKAKNGSKDWIGQEVQKLLQDPSHSRRSFEIDKKCLIEEKEAALNSRVIQLLERQDQALMLSALATIYFREEGVKEIFQKLIPQGMAQFGRGEKKGNILFARDVFFTHKMLDDKSFYNKNLPQKGCPQIPDSMAVIASKDLSRAFVGNTLQMHTEESKGYVTLAVDIDNLLKNLVLSVHQDAFLVHQNQVITAFSSDGVKNQNTKDPIPFTKEMLHTKSGEFQWKGISYYYLHMVPFPKVDLHFFIFEPQSQAFALMHALDQGSREVINKVSANMRVIALIGLILVLLLLNNVAKRVSTPIVKLAAVTKQVAAGQLESIDLPDISEEKNDEIATLCRSFNQMVFGLREKEKVKGILNKVVSPEIAEEIMKDTIHLGGEIRKLTVFFADIRGFTKMSAHMIPNQVIEMLNLCMTKISHVIDEFGGVIDKYVGDEVMALFGAPIQKEDSALKAIECGLKVIEVLRQWNRERLNLGLEIVEMGIGIHTGEMLVGNMGAENRLNYTVIGSNVNLAARLCSAAKGMEILISKETLQEPHVQENILVEEKPSIALKGFDTSMVLYSVKGQKHV